MVLSGFIAKSNTSSSCCPFLTGTPSQPTTIAILWRSLC